MADYTREDADAFCKALYRTPDGKQFLDFLMDQAGIGKSLASQDQQVQNRKIGAHDFAVENIKDRIERKPRSKK